MISRQMAFSNLMGLPSFSCAFKSLSCSLTAERAALDELRAAGCQLRSMPTNVSVFGGGRKASLALVSLL